LPVVATRTKPPDVKDRIMATKKPCVMLMLAAVAAVSLNTVAQAQQVRRGNPRSKITVRRDTTRSGVPGKVIILRPGPNTLERPKRTVEENEFAAAAARLARYKEWMIGANVTGFVYPNTTGGPSSRKYNLKGSAIRKFLQYEKQGWTGGINLGWTDDASARTAIDRAQWIIQRPGGSGAQSAPVVYGEPIALGWAKSGRKIFLKFSKRNAGINLTWSEPSYEWTILGRLRGTRVRRGQDLVILYNLRHLMPMMYVNRSRGGDIGFAPDNDSAYVMSLRNAANYMMTGRNW